MRTGVLLISTRETSPKLKCYIAAAIAMLAFFTSPARGQATQPSHLTWKATVTALADALVGGEAVEMKNLLADGATVHTFQKDHPEDWGKLLQQTASSELLGAHAYLHPPMVMAADIAADFKNAIDVPPEVKTAIAPDDESDMKRANATAVQWVAAALDAGEGHFVGVIVLWRPVAQPPGVNSTTPPGAATFVLVKAKEISPNQFRVSKIVYGDPLPN